MTNHLRKALSGAMWIFSLGLISYALSFLLRIVLARTLPIEEFGLFFAMLSLILVATVFRDLGLNAAAAKYIAEANAVKNKSKIKTIVTTSVFLQFIHTFFTIILFLVLTSFLVTKYFRASGANTFPIFLSFYLLASILLPALKALLRGLQDMFRFALADVLKNLFTLLVYISLWVLGMNLLAAVWAYIFGSLLAFGTLLLISLKRLDFTKNKFKSFRKTTKQLYSFGIPVTFVGFGDMLLAYLDILILTYVTSLTSVGIYSAILPTAMLFLFFGRAVSGVILPTVSNLWKKKEYDKVQDGLQLVHKYLPTIVIPVILTAFVFSREIIYLVFGPAFLPGVFAFKILLIGTLFYMLAQINHETISAIGKPKVTAKIIGLVALTNAVLNIILIPVFDITGAAIATTISYFLALILSSTGLKKLAKVKIQWSVWIRLTLAALVFLIVSYATLWVVDASQLVEAAITIPLALVSYGLVIVVLRIANLKEVRSLVKQISK